MNDFNIPEKLKIIRDVFGLKQSQLAEILEMKQSQYSLLETGKATIALEKIGVLNEKLNISPVWIMMQGNSIPTEKNIITGMKSTLSIENDSVSFPSDAWEMIKSQQRIIETLQADLNKARNEAVFLEDQITMLKKKLQSAGNARNANAV